MIDLFCLVADKNMEAAFSALLNRAEAFGVSQLTCEIVVHPHRDPGCFYQSPEILQGFRDSARKALVVLDLEWSGAPGASAEALEMLLDRSLHEKGLYPWAQALVIDPELEAWVFSDSPHVAASLGWTTEELRRELSISGLWPEGSAKPKQPKAAMERALWLKRKPRSSAIYRELAKRVSFQRCQDRSFLKFRKLMAELSPSRREDFG